MSGYALLPVWSWAEMVSCLEGVAGVGSLLAAMVVGAVLALFFFQAEDGIRDLIVTGVQTCALPICTQGAPRRAGGRRRRAGAGGEPGRAPGALAAVRVQHHPSAPGRTIGRPAVRRGDRKSVV